MYLDEIELGTSVRVSGAAVTKEEMLSFADSYNPAKIHCDEEYAKTTRFGQLIAPGFLTFFDDDYEKLCPWASVMQSGKVWPDELTDAVVEVLASEKDNREQRRKKRHNAC